MTSSRLTQFTHDGLTFEVSDSGPVAGPLDGEAVVLLHGFPQDRHCWRAVRERKSTRLNYSHQIISDAGLSSKKKKV